MNIAKGLFNITLFTIFDLNNKRKFLENKMNLGQAPLTLVLQNRIEAPPLVH